MISLNRSVLTRTIILLSILVPLVASAQVKIKERIAVSPRTLSSVSKTLEGDSTLVVRLDWDLNYPTLGAVRFVAADASLLEEGTNYQIHSVAYSPSGLYVFYIWHYGWPDSVHVTLRLQKANEPELQYFFAIGPYSGTGIPPGASMHLGEFWEDGKPFTTPFARWFSLDLGRDSINAWETNSFRITGRIDTSTAIRWYPTIDSVTLTIKSGAELGGFLSQDNALLGTSVTMLAGDIGSLVFAAGGSVSEGSTVTIEAKSKGILETKEFKVLAFVGSRLKLHTVSPMAFSEGRYFNVEVLDANGTVVPMPPGITFTYKIFEGKQWGTLYDAYSDRRDSIISGAVSNMGLYSLDTARYDDKRVRLCATADGYQLTPDTAEVLIIPGNLKLRVTPQGSLKYGQSALIEAEGIYRSGELQPVFPGILYTYEIVESPDAGYLTAEGDTAHLDLRTDIGPEAAFHAKEETPQADSVRVIVKVIATQITEDARMDGVGPTRPKAPRVLSLARGGNVKLQGTTEDIGVARISILKELLCARVVFDTSHVSPGDTIGFTIANEDGTPFPAHQKFKVWIFEGASNTGQLVANGTSNWLLDHVEAPVKYVAPAEIEGSSREIHIAARAYPADGGSTTAIPLGGITKFRKSADYAKGQKINIVTYDSLVNALGRLLTESVCSLPAMLTVEYSALPSSLILSANPQILTQSGSVSLPVSLKPSPPNAGAYTVTFRAGDPIAREGEGFAELSYNDSEGNGIAGVPYLNAKSGQVKYKAVPGAYTSRFPLKIMLRAYVDGHESLEDQATVTLKGAHTVGEYFSQSDATWGGDDYDTYVRFIDDEGVPAYWTITDKGCALSCMAMVLKAFGCDVDPKKLNNWMSDPSQHSKYNRRSGFLTEYGDVDWVYDLLTYPDSPIGCSMPIGEKLPRPIPTTALDYNLSLGYPSFVQYTNPRTGNPHWGVVTGKSASGMYTILDPEHRNPSVLDPEDIYKFRMVMPKK